MVPGGREVFLTAEWRDLAVLNFEIDREVLQARVPGGTELDDFGGRPLLSVVGFLFLDTRILGVRVPFHANFEEVNLRFYVRRKAPEGWRRAVVFVREFVPRLAIALTARAVYGENYSKARMSHRIEDSRAEGIRRVSYEWGSRGCKNRLGISTAGEPHRPEEGSHEELVTEHYWGYARQKDGDSLEYHVEHPPWRIWKARDASLDCDVRSVYGEEFVGALKSPPVSAFLVEGSRVSVSKGVQLTP